MLCIMPTCSPLLPLSYAIPVWAVPPAGPRTTLKGRQLILNMDINKTVIMTDSVSGKTPEIVVNEEIAACAWGYEVDGAWQLAYDEPACLKPQRAGEARRLESFAEYVMRRHPGGTNKAQRARIKASFTQPGQPGAKLAPVAEQMLASLKRPDGGEVQLIPAFFHLLLYLKKERRSFTLCFRTFGQDLSDVARELTDFCEGRHPMNPGVRMDGSDGDPDYRLRMEPDRCGTFHREEGKLNLIMGTVLQPPEDELPQVDFEGLEFFRRIPDTRIFSGFSQVRDYLSTRCSQCGTLGLRDFFPYWKAKGMTSEGGKVFMFDKSKGCAEHALFFDDNLKYEDFYIAQPINVAEPHRRHLALSLLQSHMCKAEPLEAIRDPQYFVKHVLRLEEGFNKSCAARERLRRLLVAAAITGKWRCAAQKISSYDPWRTLRKSACTSQHKGLAEIEEEELRAF